MTFVQADTPYWILAIVFAIMGHGMGSTMAPMTAAVMNSVGHERAGLGSAMTNTSREVGGVFGIALLGTLLTTRLRQSIEPALATIGLSADQQRAVAEAARQGVVDPAVLGPLSPGQRAAVVDAFRRSFMTGFRLSLIVAGAVLLVAAVIANRFIPGRDHAREVTRLAAEARAGQEPVLEL
jgi:DHA2 family integral membrane protein (MFS transporter)